MHSHHRLLTIVVAFLLSLGIGCGGGEMNQVQQKGSGAGGSGNAGGTTGGASAGTTGGSTGGTTGGGTGAVTPGPPNPGGSIASVNHIIMLVQENRSFDHYFGKLNAYRVSHGLPADVDGLPDDDKAVTNIGYDGSEQHLWHMKSVCTTNLSSAWNETRADVTRDGEDYPLDPARMDGFAHVAGHYASGNRDPDVAGKRAMGYFTERELPYYYFMATQFATADRFFSIIPSRTDPNRMALLAATSAGHAYPLNESHSGQVNAKTIFELLDKAHISWKIYSPDRNNSSHGTYFTDFTYADNKLDHIVDMSEYTKDVMAGTLPAVAVIESGVEDASSGISTGIDEHPEDNVQIGAQWAADKINTLMRSPSWKDSVFFLTYDEGGGFYDHVPPLYPVPVPDGIDPIDVAPHDNPGTFNITGFRVPVIVISPFAKQHFVSHTPMDNTAVLKFIETRFGLPNLTKRDAAMPDMQEFFDWVNMPWQTPPTPPNQPVDAPCYYSVP
ncbi:MAG TPA: alkaline phosphatase family protein [Terriglobales bacterium]